jgi:hypothetical protein
VSLKEHESNAGSSRRWRLFLLICCSLARAAPLHGTLYDCSGRWAGRQQTSRPKSGTAGSAGPTAYLSIQHNSTSGKIIGSRRGSHRRPAVLAARPYRWVRLHFDRSSAARGLGHRLSLGRTLLFALLLAPARDAGGPIPVPPQATV